MTNSFAQAHRSMFEMTEVLKFHCCRRVDALNKVMLSYAYCSEIKDIVKQRTVG